MPWRPAPIGILTAVLLAAPALADRTLAGETAPFTSPQSTVTLVSDTEALAPGQPFRLGLRQRLAPGWHTYWSNPGDAGEPPQLSLTMPEGGTAGDLQFPSPERIPYGPLVNFGYEHEVLFPIEVSPPATLRPGDRFTVQADAYWLVCAEICIPEETSFSLALPVEATARPAGETAGLFVAAEAALPRPSPWQASAGFSEAGGVLQLSGEALSPETVEKAFFFPAEWGVIENAAPQALTVGPGTLSLSLTRAQGKLPERLDGIIAITDRAGSRSTYQVAAGLGAVPTAESPAVLPLWQAVVFAALGGLLLNLMPCVFPILAMKAVGIAQLSGADHRAVRGHAGSYTAGVVLSFLALGAVILALRAGGMAAGWGFQFTSPLFVAAMSWLMLAVGLNLSGVYGAGGPVTAGGGLAARGGHAGSFATGAFAVLVATPCTAPFMAAAIGAAFAMPPAATLAVFFAMGIGTALPYGLLGLFPGAARLLPRPGIWMERLKQVLAFPMYAASAWLVWVLTLQAGADGVLLALGGALLVAFAAWALGTAQSGGARAALVGRGAAAVAVLAALAVLPWLDGETAASRAAGTAVAEPWTAARVAELQADGRPVFVNLTAAWCITCKVNERMALDTAAVQVAFQAGNWVQLEGDWTNGDPAITALLKSQGREGVPLYLLYPASGGAPDILPQILTQSIVLQALEANRPAPKVSSASSS